jgi:hypothetical protein
VLAVLRRPGFPLAPFSMSGSYAVVLALFLVAYVGLRRWRERTEAEEARRDALCTGTKPQRGEKAFEYRSTRTLFGLPLVHVNLSGSTARPWKTARGWIALSDGFAVGGIFAGGWIAIAPASFGGLAVGLLGIGFICAGGWAAGGVALGKLAMGGFAVAWTAAEGSRAIAHEFARGSSATDPAVATFMHDHIFFRVIEAMWPVFNWTPSLMWLPPLVLIGWYLWRRRGVR